MSDKRSGTNNQGNDYTSYGGDRGNYYYRNADGGRYYNAGDGQGSFYRNSDKGYQWYQNSSGERSYQSYGNGSGGQSGQGGQRKWLPPLYGNTYVSKNGYVRALSHLRGLIRNSVILNAAVVLCYPQRN